MFGEVMPDDIPIVEVSIDASLNPRQHWEIGSALKDLRSVLSEMPPLAGPIHKI